MSSIYSSSASSSSCLSDASSSTSISGFSGLTSPPATPRSLRRGTFASHESLRACYTDASVSRRRSHGHALFSSNDKEEPRAASTEDKFTQLPSLSCLSPRSTSRHRSSSSVTYQLKKRKSLAGLIPSDNFDSLLPASPSLPDTSHTSTLSPSGTRDDLSSLLRNTTATPTIPRSASSRRESIAQHAPTEGRRLSRKYIEASRRAAKEAVDEDMRALSPVGASSLLDDEYALDCYFTALDYLLKAIKLDDGDAGDLRSRRALRVRLQAAADALMDGGDSRAGSAPSAGPRKLTDPMNTARATTSASAFPTLVLAVVAVSLLAAIAKSGSSGSGAVTDQVAPTLVAVALLYIALQFPFLPEDTMYNGISTKPASLDMWSGDGSADASLMCDTSDTSDEAQSSSADSRASVGAADATLLTDTSSMIPISAQPLPLRDSVSS